MFQVFEAVPGKGQSRAPKDLSPLEGGEGRWPSPGSSVFPVYPAVPGRERGREGREGAGREGAGKWPSTGDPTFPVYPAVPGREEE